TCGAEAAVDLVFRLLGRDGRVTGRTTLHFGADGVADRRGHFTSAQKDLAVERSRHLREVVRVHQAVNVVTQGDGTRGRVGTRHRDSAVDLLAFVDELGSFRAVSTTVERRAAVVDGGQGQSGNQRDGDDG